MESHISHCRTCQVVCDSTSKTVRIVTDSGSFYLRPEAAQPLVAQNHGEDTGEPGILTYRAAFKPAAFKPGSVTTKAPPRAARTAAE
jgi:hypothetical protein